MTRFTLPTLVFAGAALFACTKTPETVEVAEAAEACADYCDKRFDCADRSPDDDELDACEARCEDDLEDACGEDDRPVAVDTLNDCVELSCVEFAGCLVFEAAPACFGFTDENDEA